MKTFQKRSHVKGLLFVLALWLLSRLVVVVAMQFFAPLAFTTPVHPEWGIGSSPPGFVPGYIPKAGWELFSHWDSKWYQSIATSGYEYVNDGQQHSIAFFPLFPLVVRAVMTLGLPFEIAGTLVNNLVVLGTLMLLYVWLANSQGGHAAKWVVAVLTWCPSSVFGTVIYTEGLFLFVSTAALQAFDRHHYRWAAFWGVLASATRIFGIGLIPTFLFVAWRESRPPIAYLAGLITSGGLLLFCLYASIQFGDPLAFLHAQQGWDHESLLEIIKNALALDRASLFSMFAFLGSGFVLWQLRSKMPPVISAYGLFSLLLIIGAATSGISTASLPRYLYGIVSVSVGLGLWFACHPRWWGYATLLLFAILLFQDAFHFAGWDFIG